MKDNSARFSIRFNLNKPAHQSAWETLNEIPSGERSEFIIKALAGYKDELSDAGLKRALSETANEIKAYIDRRLSVVPVASANPKDELRVSRDVLDFMKGL